MFSTEQKAALAAPLHREHVKQRSQSGRSLSYIEGWHAIAEANRIFGFDAWSRETTDIRCVAEGARPIGKEKTPGFGVTYIAKVRVVVDGIAREGYGTGHGVDRDLGLAHESAIKEAETDAMKRALMTFGNPFGLALYDKTQAHVEDAPSAAQVEAEQYTERAIKEIVDIDSVDRLNAWWKSEERNRKLHFQGINDPNYQRLREAARMRGVELSQPTQEAAQ